MVDRPAAIAAEDTRGVGVVDHHDGPVLLCQCGQLVDGADVAVHRKDAVGDDELLAGIVLDLLEQLFAVRDVFVAEDLDPGAGEACTVDDAGVVELVGEDEVFFAEDGAYGAGVGGEAGLEDYAGFDVLEAGDFFFELHVDAHGAGDGAYGSGAYAVVFDGLDGGCFESWVVAEAEVVVTGEVDDLASVVGADGGLGVVELAEFEEGSGGLEGVELGGKMR